MIGDKESEGYKFAEKMLSARKMGCSAKEVNGMLEEWGKGKPRWVVLAVVDTFRGLACEQCKGACGWMSEPHLVYSKRWHRCSKCEGTGRRG